jgi:RAB protein geranylgeranyltransferase component A
MLFVDTTGGTTSHADGASLKSDFIAQNKQRYSNISLREIEWPSNTDEIAKDSIATVLSKHSRQFNLELAPKLLASQGKLVDLLVTSDIGKYLDFRLVDAIYLYINSLELVCHQYIRSAILCINQLCNTTADPML